MADFPTDQASGLRRLFARPRQRIVAFAAGSPGVGRSTLLANLAADLARQGKDVLVLDENDHHPLAAFFGAKVRADLQQVVAGELALGEVLQAVAPGVRILPLARALPRLGVLGREERERLRRGFAGLDRQPDVILVDAAAGRVDGLSAPALAAQDTVIVITPAGESITEAYATIKKASLGHVRHQFRILVNQARGAREARTIFGNMAKVAAAKGLARLDYAGYVPRDENLRQALRLGQPAIALFPDAPGVRACRELAAAMLDWPPSTRDDGGLDQFVQQLLHLSQDNDPVAACA